MTLNEKIHKFLAVRPNAIPPYTGHRRMGRIDLIKIFEMAGYNYGVEIGVNKGGHSLLICENLPGVNLFCIDPWTAYFRKDRQHKHDAAYAEAKEKLAPYEATLLKDVSLNAVKSFKDGALDFVYIDGNHKFDSCMSDLIAWSPKVKIGGIISGHDYVPHYDFGVIEAVNAYTRAHHIDPWYIIKGRQNTYFWVKKNND